MTSPIRPKTTTGFRETATRRHSGSTPPSIHTLDGQARSTPISHRRVLLVEDDPRITTALCIRLRSCGHRLSHAADFNEAIDKVIDERPDVAVLDINLPDGNGLRLAERMRRLRETTDLPLVIITASRDPSYHERAAGLDVPLLEKPFAAERLIDAIERVCDPGAQRRSLGSTQA